jgi:hypothetical protein
MERLMRLDYRDVNLAVLDPDYAVIDGTTLVLSGYVRWDGLGVKRIGAIPKTALVPILLCIAPVTDFRFERLEKGTGELIPGDLVVTETGANIEGVVPGALVVRSPTRPDVWFESSVLVGSGLGVGLGIGTESEWSMYEAHWIRTLGGPLPGDPRDGELHTHLGPPDGAFDLEAWREDPDESGVELANDDDAHYLLQNGPPEIGPDGRVVWLYRYEP